MNSKVMDQISQIIEARAQAQPTPMEFELAYQARVAVDRIRFAIEHTEQFAPRTDQMQEAGQQLLDALERLETAERCFQERWAPPSTPRKRDQEVNIRMCNGQATGVNMNRRALAEIAHVSLGTG